MKIFYICYADLGTQAAWTTHIREVVENLKKIGNEVILFAPKLGKLETDLEIRSVYVPTVNVRLLSEYIYYFLLFFYLAAYQMRSKADIFYVREMGLSLPVALVSKLFNIPHIIEVNGRAIEERKLIGVSHRKICFLKILQRINFSLCSKIIIVADFIRDYLKTHYEIPEHNMVTIENGVNIELFRPLDSKKTREKLGFSDDLYYITYVGSFYPHHALDYLVKLTPFLLERIENVRVLLVGEGHVKNEIENLVTELGLEKHINLFGGVDYHDVPSFVNAADVCVMLYLFPEEKSVYSLKLLEYLSCGKPVVVNWKAFGSKLFSEEEIGIQINLNNLEDAADKIVRLLKDEAYRKKIGKRARKFIEENYSWHRTAKKILEVCQGLRS